ncbi:hypothetical protein GCM10011573_22260 [Enterococcus wangshanyuanii]|uniref:Uncharacterized protein n=1 Tax=Enterococcus wangshanyuanii TaxID=2005703 RepID=A0ABQ1P8F4_9ENTE|nr:hypothetical protein GCM10011573_22260 [Enterococcus wangshanyuanii]
MHISLKFDGKLGKREYDKVEKNENKKDFYDYGKKVYQENGEYCCIAAGQCILFSSIYAQ